MALPGQALAGRDESLLPSSADHPRVNDDSDRKGLIVPNAHVGTGNGVPKIHEDRARRISYADFDVAVYASAVSANLPIAPTNSFDHPSGPTTGAESSFRVQNRRHRTSLVSLVSYNIEADGSQNDEIFNERSSIADRLPKIPPMFTEGYRMPINSVKSPPYKHLQASTSVESNETPPLEQAGGGSPAALTHTAYKASPQKANSVEVGSSLTMSTSVTERQKSGHHRTQKVHPAPHGPQLGQNSQQSSNDDDAQSSDLTYHPNSPRTNKKPMIFERGPSRAGSANLLRVPDSVAMAGGVMVVGPLSSDSGETTKDGKLPDLEKGGGYMNGTAFTPRYSNGVGGRVHEKTAHINGKTGVYMNDDRRQVDFILVYERSK